MNLPMVVDVTEESRPSTHENGRETKIALVPIFPTCREFNDLGYRKMYNLDSAKSCGRTSILTNSCSRKQK